MHSMCTHKNPYSMLLLKIFMYTISLVICPPQMVSPMANVCSPRATLPFSHSSSELTAQNSGLSFLNSVDLIFSWEYLLSEFLMVDIISRVDLRMLKINHPVFFKRYCWKHRVKRAARVLMNWSAGEFVFFGLSISHFSLATMARWLINKHPLVLHG